MRNVGIFGASSFGQGPWRPGNKVWAIALVGASEIDFRQAQLDEGVTKVTSIVIIGRSKIVAPSDMSVTVTGLSILGTKTMKRQLAKEIPPATAKSLKVNCFTLLGCSRITDKG